MRIDIGCGPNKKGADWIGIDQFNFPGVNHVLDVSTAPLPFADGTVEEVHMSHFLEHLDAKGRCHLLNELYRVMKPGAKATVIVPHWGSSRAYGDPTHQWPPIGEFFFNYLSREWRRTQAPHSDKSNWPDGYDCDFECTWGYGMHQMLTTRNTEFQQFALNFYREAAQDLHATLTRK